MIFIQDYLCSSLCSSLCQNIHFKRKLYKIKGNKLKHYILIVKNNILEQESFLLEKYTLKKSLGRI